MICKLCGQTINEAVTDGKLKCSHCGLYVFFDGEGNELGYSMTDSLHAEAEETAEAEVKAEAEAVADKEEVIPRAVIDPKKLVRILISACLSLVLVIVTVIGYSNISKEYLAPLGALRSAEKQINNGEALKAYNTLLPFKDDPRISEMLSRFVFKPSHKKTLSDDIYYEYYPNGLLKSEVNLYSNNNYASITLYIYNGQGTLIREELYAYDPNEKTAEALEQVHFYEYNERGLLIKEYSAFSNGALGAETEYVYDEKDRMITAKYGDTFEETFEYDELDRIIRKNTTWSETVYTYDENGNRITEDVRSLTDPKDDMFTKRTFDKYGNVLSEVSSGFYANGETIYEYKYDEFGNVLKQYTINKNGSKQARMIYEGYICFYVQG